MPNSQFYTRSGDDGTTGLLGSGRVPKHDPRPEAYGTVDEAQAAIGIVRASDCTTSTAEILLAIQRDLYVLMAELAAAGHEDSPFYGSITASHVAQLEEWIAKVEAEVQMPREFVIPGDSWPGAALHVARTVVRRAERSTVRMTGNGLLGNEQVVHYLNRLSSLLFALAIYEDQAASTASLTLAREERDGRRA